MAATLQEADAIVELVDQYRIKLCVPHYARHSLAFLTMQKMIALDATGSPLIFPGRGKEDHRGGGEDLFVPDTHILDMQNLFFGPPLSVHAQVNVDGHPIGPAAGDDIFASFRLANGVRGIFESRRGLAVKGVPRMGVSVVGSEGVLTMRFHDAQEKSPLRISNNRGALENGAVFTDVPLHEFRVFPSAAEPLDYSLCGKELPYPRFFSNHTVCSSVICSTPSRRIASPSLTPARRGRSGNDRGNLRFTAPGGCRDVPPHPPTPPAGRLGSDEPDVVMTMTRSGDDPAGREW